jgi:FSR family fosmidomycin resistance protein-like MFS transporter
VSDTTAAPSRAAEKTTLSIIVAVAVCHCINDICQSLLTAIYPILKESYGLDFVEIGLLTFTFQVTASLLQPLIGHYADKRFLPYSLAFGMGSTLCGLVVLGYAGGFALLLVGAALIGLGSAVFHPESSRVARLASGGRYGLAQSLFQVGGNLGHAIGPLLAAFIVIQRGQESVSWFGVMALLGIALLTFSKNIYMAVFTSYYTFYAIDRFGVTIQDSQLLLFAFLGASTIGVLAGGPIGDRFGPKFVIWFSIAGVIPFTLLLPYADLTWTTVLTIVIGFIFSSAFSAIVVFAQELVPGRVGMVAGVFFGLAFGIAGIAAAVLGAVADVTGIQYVFWLCSFLPLLGLLTVFLPDMQRASAAAA